MRFSLIIIFACVLSACGGNSDRDTAFKPGGSSSSAAASVGAAITMEEIYRFKELTPAQPSLVDTTNKQIFIIRTIDEYNYFRDMYANAETISEVDFNTEQVVLLDIGNIGTCSQAVNYSGYKANEYSDNTVLITLNYRESESSSDSSASSSSESSCENAEEKRPFYFYRIVSRKKLLVHEELVN